jgi:nucleoside-diphosphate-sugar epimerase
MVIGTGLMAKAFEEFKNDAAVIVFASGVSNSKETNPDAYERELSLLKSIEKTDAVLIYFSTCSIFDPFLKDSLYVKHKKSIEAYIASRFEKFWIFRLPNVIGKSPNPNTLTNFFYTALKNNVQFELYENAYRYFIDIADVKEVISSIIKQSELKWGSYNLLFPEALPVKDLVSLFETHLNKKAVFHLKEDAGTFYDVKMVPEMRPYLNFNAEETSCNYIRKIIEKYYLK